MGQLDLLVKPSFSNREPKYSDWLKGTTKAELVMINRIKAITIGVAIIMATIGQTISVATSSGNKLRTKLAPEPTVPSTFEALRTPYEITKEPTAQETPPPTKPSVTAVPMATFLKFLFVQESPSWILGSIIPATKPINVPIIGVTAVPAAAPAAAAPP